MTEPGTWIALAAVASAVTSVTTSAISASKPPPGVPDIEDKNIQARRKAAIARAQHSFGLGATRVAGDSAIGATLAQGNTILGAPGGAESNI